MCTTCSTLARGLEPGAAPPSGDWFIEHAIGRRGVPVAYTVGLTGMHQPELIIREVAYSVAHGILHELVDRAVEWPARLQPGTATGPGGRELLLRRYAHSIELTQAIARYEGIIAVLQVVPAPLAGRGALQRGSALDLARGRAGA